MLRRLIGNLFWVMGLLSVAVVVAQDNCSVFVEDAWLQVDRNCAGLQGNRACYGHDLVQASFVSDVSDNFFSAPADTVNVIDLEMINTVGLDETADVWGVAVMSLHATLPDTLPGQNVIFVLLGDTEVESAVEWDDAFVPIESIEVVAAFESNIRSGPGLNFNVIERVPIGTVLTSDGRSADGEWLRVVLDERIAWMSRYVLVEDRGMDDLPLLRPDLRTSMQAFYLRTGIGRPSCVQVPDDILLVQGPKDIEIDLTINGANIRVGSTVSFRLLAEDVMEIFVIDGQVQVLDANYQPTGLIARAGQRITACLSEPEDRGLDGEANDRIVACDFTPPEWIPSPVIASDWCMMQRIPENILNYPIDLICPGEILPTPIPIVPATLRPTPHLAPTSTPNAAGVDCSTFVLIEPFDGITPRPTLFRWTEAPGATDYEIVFYNYEGNVAETFFTQDTEILLNVGEIPTGSELAWEVRAYREDVYACVTARTPMIFRLADPNPPPQATAAPVVGAPPPAVPFAASMSCVSPGVLGVLYNNAPGGTTDVTVTYTDPALGPQSITIGSVPSGLFNVSLSVAGGYTANTVQVVANPGGSTVSLGSISCP